MVLHYDGMARSLLGDAVAAALPPQLQPPRHEAYDPEDVVPSAAAAATSSTHTKSRTQVTRWERRSLSAPDEDVDMERPARSGGASGDDEYDPERPAM